MTLKSGATTINIPIGNWDACSFISYLNQNQTLFGAEFDSARLVYIFTPSITISAGTTAQRLLGFPSGTTGTFTESTIPVKFSGPQLINVDTDISLFNVPISTRLASIPVTCNYGDILQYVETSGMLPVFAVDHSLRSITITLNDEDNEELTCYEDHPWYLVLEIKECPNKVVTTM